MNSRETGHETKENDQGTSSGRQEAEHVEEEVEEVKTPEKAEIR